ncbi:MAG: peptidoglycan-binding protein [Bacteroidia bacterium]|nr:peptidoglycan-binding protein [Bacteroidia bacterium]NND12105.1 peptidoglycan-binding protein [Flavobacteriaceae bacterium]NNK27782.1 peptidoglycan-binding protein [Flavobacteriaceae bacterium]
MKQIIIFLLVVILLIISYGQYTKYKRFTPPEYEYQLNQDIDLNYHDRSFLLDYYESVEGLNGFVITQWSANNIDVRNPEDDDKATQASVSEYSKKLGLVKYHEDQLVKSKRLKESGLANSEIKLLEEQGTTLEQHLKLQNDKRILTIFNNNIDQLKMGKQSAFVYELQKLLVKKGYDIPLDGVYKVITKDAIMAFEEKNKLFPDGDIDQITLEALLE